MNTQTIALIRFESFSAAARLLLCRWRLWISWIDENGIAFTHWSVLIARSAQQIWKTWWIHCEIEENAVNETENVKSCGNLSVLISFVISELICLFFWVFLALVVRRRSIKAMTKWKLLHFDDFRSISVFHFEVLCCSNRVSMQIVEKFWAFPLFPPSIWIHRSSQLLAIKCEASLLRHFTRFQSIWAN
jgi:hypothetical protein